MKEYDLSVQSYKEICFYSFCRLSTHWKLIMLKYIALETGQMKSGFRRRNRFVQVATISLHAEHQAKKRQLSGMEN